MMLVLFVTDRGSQATVAVNLSNTSLAPLIGALWVQLLDHNYCHYLGLNLVGPASDDLKKVLGRLAYAQKTVGSLRHFGTWASSASSVGDVQRCPRLDHTYSHDP